MSRIATVSGKCVGSSTGNDSGDLGRQFKSQKSFGKFQKIALSLVEMETRVDRGKILETIIHGCGSLYSPHRTKAGIVQAHSRLPSVPPPRDSWFLTNGVIAAGPTPFDNVARSVAEGRVSRSVFVRHASWNVWQRYEDIEELDTFALGRLVDRLGRASAGIEEGSNQSGSDKTPVPSIEEAPSSARSQRVTRSSIRPVSVDPVGVLGQARDMDEAFLLTLSTAVAAAAAHVGLLHRYNDNLGTAVTSCAQGSGMERLLGARIPMTDPVLAAAQSGTTIIGEPNLGEAGRYIAARFNLAGVSPIGVAMIPIRLFDKLLATLEVGQIARAFTAREVSRIEDVADVLAERLVVNGWFELPV